MSKKYPRIYGYRRKPDADKDGDDNYGKPCIFCGTPTCGEKWLQISYMRCEDETVRVCAKDWNAPGEMVIDAILEQGSHYAEWRNR